ncbi:enhanced intracellular survival protein Eis [Lacticaseibacillus jixianensis]|uniref:Enhanced intracellular survival protein Eis n=1 Tax=Lacticaseibacillus jixianensis TaxID=2486012 RepID=A0ABW4B616_9LACO|nr:GNAT family N-acetyltransferase [Lacticaseibacillus jixianensis]
MSNYRLTAQDRDAFYQLYLFCFNGTDSPERRAFFDYRYDHGWIYGRKRGKKLVSGLYNLPFTINFHGVDYRMNGIGDVMSAPEASGLGGAGSLLQASLEEMLEKGVTLAYLSPFSYAYYRRYGYEQVFNHMVYQISNEQMPACHPKFRTGEVERLTWAEALPTIRPLYEAQADNMAGGMKRPAWWWHYLQLKRNWDVAVYRSANGVPEGYIAYERDGGTILVKEVITQTAMAYQHLLEFIASTRNTFHTIAFDDPDSRYRGDLLPEPAQLKAESHPYMMARIVDLADFLTRYPYSIDELTPVTFAVTDANLAANQGTWRLTIHAGQGSVTKLSDTADKAITIQALTKAAFGATPLSRLIMTGEVELPNSTAAALDQGFVQTPPIFQDYF